MELEDPQLKSLAGEKDSIEFLLVGAVILAPKFIDAVQQVCRPTDFFHRDLGQVFDRIISLHEAGKPVSDLQFLLSDLYSQGLISRSDPMRLSPVELVKSVDAAVPNNAMHYATQIRGYAVSRDLSLMAGKLKYKLDAGEDANRIVSWIDSETRRIEQRISIKTASIREHGNTVMDRFVSGAKSEVVSHPTGIYSLDLILGGLRSSELIILGARPSNGKCFAPGTKIRMADGDVVNIENIRVGDFVQGPDGRPRKVLMSHSGIDQMYEIIQKYGQNYTVNSQHEVVLVRTKTDYNKKKGDICIFSAEQVSKKPSSFFRRHHGFRKPCEGTDKKGIEHIDPYFLGLWLGDGTSSNSEIATIDSETIDWLGKYATELGHELIVKQRRTCLMARIKNMRKGRGSLEGKRTTLHSKLRMIGVLNNKHIPKCYLTSSKETRMQLLAGIIDTDGSYSPINHLFDLVQVNKRLSKDIQKLCWSLGLRCNVSKKFVNGTEYQRMAITGNIQDVPVRLVRKKAPPYKKRTDPSETPIKIREAGIGPYVGIAVDGDKLFMLEDGTVVHNTSLAMQIMTNIARSNETCLFFSLEMKGTDLATREIAAESQIEFKKISMGDLTAEDLGVMQIRAESLPARLIICEDQKINAKQIRAISKVTQASFGLSFVAIDYLGLVRPDDPRKPRHEQINDIVESMKTLAGELKCPVMLLSQLNRSADGEKQPRVSHLALSGSIEQAADVIILLHNPPNKQDGIAEIMVEKQRNGATGVVPMNFNRAQTRFEER